MRWCVIVAALVALVLLVSSITLAGKVLDKWENTEISKSCALRKIELGMLRNEKSFY